MKRGVKPTPVAEHEQRFHAARTESWAAALEAFASLRRRGAPGSRGGKWSPLCGAERLCEAAGPAPRAAAGGAFPRVVGHSPWPGPSTRLVAAALWPT